MTSRWCLEGVSDAELFPALERWAGAERQGCAMVLAHIAEIDRRRLFLDRGYQSMHDYCVRGMNFSESAAYKRIGVARAGLRNPRILDMIASGELHLSGAYVMVPVVDEENVDRLLDAAAGQTKRAIEVLVAAEAPRPDVPTRICEVAGGGATLELPPGAAPNADQVAQEPEYARVEALAPKRYSLTVTISQETHDKLRHAQDLERHAVPDGDVARILERALDVLIETSMKRQFAVTDRPRAGKRDEPRPEDRVSAATRRAVGARDEYRCTFVAEDGTRCNARAWAELDHEQPRSREGLPTEENMRILCGPHNRLEAERKLGAWVREIPAKKRRERTRKVKPPQPTDVFAQARAALVTLGYKATEVRAALDAVGDRVGGEATLEVVLREALCAMPPPRCREPGPLWDCGADHAPRLA